MKNIFIIPG